MKYLKPDVSRTYRMDSLFGALIKKSQTVKVVKPATFSTDINNKV